MEQAFLFNVQLNQVRFHLRKQSVMSDQHLAYRKKDMGVGYRTVNLAEVFLD